MVSHVDFVQWHTESVCETLFGLGGRLAVEAEVSLQDFLLFLRKARFDVRYMNHGLWVIPRASIVFHHSP